MTFLQRQNFVRLPLMQHLESRRLLSNYFLSPLGNDQGSGNSMTAPWKTIARADEQAYKPGDSILLNGGGTFTGDLWLGAGDSGTALLPVKIGSYGTGSATIFAGMGDGITLWDSGGINISNLIITGTGPTSNKGTGIDLFDDQIAKPRIANINVNNVSVSGFGFVGIGIGSATLTTGFANVTISNSSVNNNAAAGLFSYAGHFTANPAPYGLAHQNIVVNNVQAFGNPGYSGNNDSGNGIELGNVNGAIIEHSTAYGNGAKNVSTTGGPVGIWAYDSNAVVIEGNESYGNLAAHVDGDGFDLDGGTTNSVVEYNYSHGNDGAGILEAQFRGATASTGNIIRYNISQNDCRNQSLGGIDLWAASASNTIVGTQIYGNTIYMTRPKSASPTGIQIDQATVNVSVRNNIFDLATGLKTVLVKDLGTGLAFDGNDYWTGSGSAIGIVWGAHTYQSLTAFRAASRQEIVYGTLTGMAVNPDFKISTKTAAPTPADIIAGPAAFELAANTPLIQQGINLEGLNLYPGKTDYFGTLLPYYTRLTIGAYQIPPISVK